jgi:hypothetical protein
MSKIIFFNHYHRGDLLTHKEFIRQLQNELPDFTFEYMHFNHPKLTRDLNIPVIGAPENLDAKTPFYQDEGVLYINTWIGCFWDIFCEHGGINMNSLWHQWDKILDTINGHFNTEIALRADKESYLPKIDFTKFDVSSIDEFLKTNTNKKILICNGPPKSGQSFSDNMKDFINLAAEESPNIDFICTTKFDTTLNNVLFTDDIIIDNEIEDKRAPWEDREVNNCDLQEISYLSEHCDAIVGKNSGPFVFCETYNNYMNPNKKFLSYNVSWGIGKPPTETMSNGLDIKCKYTITPISDISTLSSDDIANIHNSLKELTDSL